MSKNERKIIKAADRHAMDVGIVAKQSFLNSLVSSPQAALMPKDQIEETGNELYKAYFDVARSSFIAGCQFARVFSPGPEPVAEPSMSSPSSSSSSSESI